jgi:hypothetical protein
MNRPIVTVGIAAALALPLNACGSHSSTRVPHIVGLTLRAAEQQLFSDHLHWRVAPGTQIYSRPLPPNEHTSIDDIPVTGQQPAARTQTRPGTAITIITPCTATHPCS